LIAAVAPPFSVSVATSRPALPPGSGERSATSWARLIRLIRVATTATAIAIGPTSAR
jgi:hypothetical protein